LARAGARCARPAGGSRSDPSSAPSASALHVATHLIASFGWQPCFGHEVRAWHGAPVRGQAGGRLGCAVGQGTNTAFLRGPLPHRSEKFTSLSLAFHFLFDQNHEHHHEFSFQSKLPRSGSCKHCLWMRRLPQLPGTDAPSAASGCPGTPHDRSNTSWTIQTTPATSSRSHSTPLDP
jgi:hypothetical protein